MNEENDAIEIDDIDLSSLSDDDLVAQMHDDLYDGLGEEIGEGTESSRRSLSGWNESCGRRFSRRNLICT